MKWIECRRLPAGVEDAQAVCVGDKLCIGGGTSESKRTASMLYIYIPTTDTWREIDTPVYLFALMTYHSQLVLVGGREYKWKGWQVTNKLWTLNEHEQWSEILPPMTTKRHSASAVEFANNILVAGGVNNKGRDVDIVEVYNAHHWAKACCLLTPCYRIKSTVLNGHWYLMGGEGLGKCVYYVSLKSLIASCQSNEKSKPSPWKTLTNVPSAQSSTAVFGNRLITVGGGCTSANSSIHAYCLNTHSWIYVGDMPFELHSTCTAVLPTRELVVIGGRSVISGKESCVYKASLYGNHFNNIILFALNVNTSTNYAFNVHANIWRKSMGDLMLAVLLRFLVYFLFIMTIVLLK